jgi:hypothetical protein
MITRIGIFAAAGLGLAAATAAPAQLVSQRTEGAYRFCAYRPVTYATPTGRDPEWRIPAGEICPSRYPGLDGPDGRLLGTYNPDTERRRLESERPIPAMATLSHVRRVGSRTICIYAHSGHEYRYVGGATLRCPMTPHFLPPGRANPDDE